MLEQIVASSCRRDVFAELGIFDDAPNDDAIIETQVLMQWLRS